VTIAARDVRTAPTIMSMKGSIGRGSIAARGGARLKPSRYIS
jgi:hypothetical protein